jgi:Zn finger protein HypA/HybF involved in hydrogenase expression
MKMATFTIKSKKHGDQVFTVNENGGYVRCNVSNCGNGQCVHKLLDELCPHCGHKMVEVITTGFKFCSNPDYQYGCDYEIPITTNGE